MTGIKTIRFRNQSKLSKAAAAFFSDLARESVAHSNRFLVAISGGNTPVEMYNQLSKLPYSNSIPWHRTHIFWCDERLVPPDHPDSNFQMAYQLFLSKSDLPAKNIHRIKGELPAAEAAAAYQQTLQAFSSINGTPIKFDLVILGLGKDGHTAALFPGPISPTELTQPVMIAEAHYLDRPVERVSLTPMILNAAHHILFLVTGEEKAEAVAAVLSGETNVQKLPAQRIQPVDGQVTWMLDYEASSLLDPHKVLYEHEA